ncbi:hypothetical protein PQC18_gp73 [Streptomyces phage Pablito]|uniref:Uncharacterized protein n=1 Tax=Streptomyces phage Pablito TaxID=2894593 RepID=A0AAE8YFC7_9CAUD|nr:hypothetical protein PQC18_gp73 [Streptomyces phage Pablito]UFD98011.1 hypothetical protein [Streptomyces phage Pablito]
MDGYSITPEYTVEQLAELLAELEYTERREALRRADEIAASHYE